MNEKVIEAIGHCLSQAHRILVVSHIRPDGDAIGSLLGLGMALHAVGQQFQMVLEDGIPRRFRHLEGSELIGKRPQGEFDLRVVVDCSDMERVGGALNGYPVPDINIDHHVTNLNFAEINFVNTKAVSTTEIIARNLIKWGYPRTKAVSDALLTGLITDTIGFRTSNMTSQALRVAADLVDLGSDLPFLYNKALVQRSFEAARFWGEGLSSLERQGELVWTILTRKNREAAQYPGRDDADLVNIMSAIDGANVAIVFVEQPNGNVKVSWRAQPGFDVSKIALSFGGGGHPAASGADIEGELDTVVLRVLRATLGILKKEEQFS